MVINFSHGQAVPLASYVIASADMYYSEQNVRVVYVRDNPENGFQIWGEIPESGSISAANLCEVYLEHALTCRAMGDLSVARYNMETFAKKLGRALADYLMTRIPPDVENPCICAMECVIESMKVAFVVEQDKGELRFILGHCPLHETALRTGLSGEELAHYGIQVLCETLVQAFDPRLSVSIPMTADAKHIFTVALPSYA